MQLGTVFSIEEYEEAYEFAIANNFTIKELEKINKKRFFQIVEIPQPTEEEVVDLLRARRENECFSIINRGQLWYAGLTTSQIEELQTWYADWLDVTETKIIPEKPTWLD